MVRQWASSTRADKALKELIEFKAKYSWAKLEEVERYLKMMTADLPKITHIVELQEAQNYAIKKKIENLERHIEVNHMADELIIDDIRKKFNIDI